MPFWKGESIGRPLELGRAVGAFVREMAALSDDDARARATAAGLDEWAADNLLAYLREQREATRHVPSDRTILVERFRDELGDWRLVVHSPFGAQVNGPWALAIAARMRERRGVEVHASGADDGIVLRLPDAVDDTGAEVVPTAEDVLLDPAEVEQIVVAELGGRRCTRRGSGSAPPAPCCSPGATRSGVPRCGSSGSGRRNCWPSPGSTSSSR